MVYIRMAHLLWNRYSKLLEEKFNSHFVNTGQKRDVVYRDYRDID